MRNYDIENDLDNGSSEVGSANEPSYLSSTKSLQHVLFERYRGHVYMAHVEGCPVLSAS